jgi:hypothetical protein
MSRGEQYGMVVMRLLVVKFWDDCRARKEEGQKGRGGFFQNRI